MTGHPTPLTHPSAKQNPLLTAKGWSPPTTHPIFDPQHPINRARGWTPNPPQMQPMQQPMMGWIPPAPQPMGIEYRQPPQMCGYGPHMPGPGRGQWMGQWEQRLPATPQMQRNAGNSAGTMFERAMIEVDTGNEPSNDTAESAHVHMRGVRRTERRFVKREGPKKRHVMLNFGGKEVLASYWEP